MAKRFGYRTAIAGLTTVALLAPTVVAPQNSVFAAQSNAQVSESEANTPEPKQNVTVLVNAPAPAAEDLIANADQLPAGTTFEVIPAIDTTKPGTKDANVFVKYPDGSRELVQVPVTVVENPAKEKVVTVKEGTLPAPTEQNPVTPQDVLNLPEEARSAVWKDGKNPTKSGTYTARVSFDDGTTRDVAVKLTFQPSKEQKIGAGVGLGLSILLSLASFLPIPAIKEANTALQKQIGIFNPQLAGAADNAVGTLSGIVGLVGIIVPSLTLAGIINPKGEVIKVSAAKGAKAAKTPQAPGTENPANDSSSKVKNFFANIGK